jgi:hypothetical protein
MSLQKTLSARWWTGIGVILATAVALLGIFWASSHSAGYTITGNCNAQGANNTVNCASASPKGTR